MYITFFEELPWVSPRHDSMAFDRYHLEPFLDKYRSRVATHGLLGLVFWFKDGTLMRVDDAIFPGTVPGLE